MSEPMTAQRLAEIRARVEAATEGEWARCECSLKGPCDHPNGLRLHWHDDRDLRPDDDEFAAHARSDIPALLDYVEELEEHAKKVHYLARNRAATQTEIDTAALRSEVERLRKALEGLVGGYSSAWQRSGTGSSLWQAARAALEGE